MPGPGRFASNTAVPSYCGQPKFAPLPEPALVMKNSMGNFEALTTVMFGGVLELFPRLKFVSV